MKNNEPQYLVKFKSVRADFTGTLDEAIEVKLSAITDVFSIELIGKKEKVEKEAKIQTKEEYMKTLNKGQLADLACGVKQLLYSTTGKFWFLQFAKPQDKEFFSPEMAKMRREEQLSGYLKEMILAHADYWAKAINEYYDTDTETEEMELIIKKICFHGKRR